MKRTIIAVGTAAVAAVAVVPASASAATIGSARSCETRIPTYNYTANANPFPNVIRVTGGTPGARYLVAASNPARGFDGSAGSQSGNFDGAGNATVVFRFPISHSLGITPSRGRATNLSVQDFGRQDPATGRFGPVIATGTTKVTTFAANYQANNRSVRSKKTITASGIPFAGRQLSAFVTKGTKGRVLKRFKLGKANECGYIRAKERVARGRGEGRYVVWIQASKKLDRKNPLTYVRTGFRISRGL